MKRKITPEEKLKVEKMYRSGKLPREIAKVIDMSVTTIYKYTSYFKLNPKRKFSKEFLENRKKNTEKNIQFSKQSQAPCRFDWRGNRIVE